MRSLGADLGPIRSGPHDPRNCTERPPAISTAGGRGRLVDVHGRPVIVYDMECAGSQAYLSLAGEVIHRERRLSA